MISMLGTLTSDLARTQLAAAEPIMVEGFGALGVVPPKYNPANDNRPGRMLKGASFYADDIEIPKLNVSDLPPTLPAAIEIHGAFELTPDSPTVEEFVESVFGKEAARGPFIQTFAGVFYPFSPSPEDIRIDDIAHGLANICRYSGACDKRYSVAEHSVHVAWWLYRHAGPQTALAGLLHDAPEALSGFGDVGRPVKVHVPVIKQIEDGIWRLAVAPAFGLPAELPRAVKEADDRIIGDEVANLKPMAWHARYDRPLGVTLQYWSPAEAEAKFLAAFEALSDEVRTLSDV